MLSLLGSLIKIGPATPLSNNPKDKEKNNPVRHSPGRISQVPVTYCVRALRGPLNATTRPCVCSGYALKI